MNAILRSISFIFHPIIMPLVGVIFYFTKSPRYLPLDIIQAKVVSLFILTILLPILIYMLLKSVGKTSSIYLQTTNERIIPLFINAIIVLLIILKVLPSNEIIELYFFFLGILVSTLSCFILAIMQIKASIHMMAVSGVFMFFLALSIHFSININGSLAFMALLTGAIATSRLHLQAHSVPELVIGLFIGFIPQLILINYWM
ncbi:hypothetical protein ACFSQP_07910 [Bizionia sediminis]|uniref:Transmembrane protein n=1 Tax=Bizionia sediminis TaxID=1737064 RepID=A0ABW5KW39_9FLAO